VTRSICGSSRRARRNSWLASRCCLAVSTTLRMVRRWRVIRSPRDISSACRRPGISVSGNGMGNLLATQMQYYNLKGRRPPETSEELERLNSGCLGIRNICLSGGRPHRFGPSLLAAQPESFQHSFEQRPAGRVAADRGPVFVDPLRFWVGYLNTWLRNRAVQFRGAPASDPRLGPILVSRPHEAEWLLCP
jgi:hypothetical protein